MYRTMIALFVLVILTGCSKTVIPETGNQVQVVLYAQIADTAKDVKVACEEKLLKKAQCIQFATSLHTAKSLVDSEGGTETVSDIIEYIRGKL